MERFIEWDVWLGGYRLVSYHLCKCGAVGVTVETPDGQVGFDGKEEYMLGRFPALGPLVEQARTEGDRMWACDHCVNRYGLDLCLCGSGDVAGKCECGGDIPSQVFGTRTVRPLWRMR